MKIRTNLLFLAIVFIISTIIIVHIAFQSFELITREIETNSYSTEIIKDVFELHIVTHEYQEHHEKRMQKQWWMKYDSLCKRLDKGKKEELHQEYHSILEAITREHKALGGLFSQLEANFAKRKKLIKENRPQTEINLSLALQDRLMAQALMRSQKVISNALRFSSASQKKTAQVKERASLILLIFIVVFAIFTCCILFFTIRSITRPVNRLAKGAEMLGKGDLNCKIVVRGKNELGQLATAFNRMAKDLKISNDKLKSYSKDLEREVKEQTRELEEAKLGLEKVKERTKELQDRVNELERYHEATVDRELRIKELLERIKELEEKKG